MTPTPNDKRVNGGIHRQYHQEGSYRDGSDEADFLTVFAGNIKRFQKTPEAELMFAVLTTALLDLSYDRDQKVYTKNVQEMRRRAQNAREGRPRFRQEKIDPTQEPYMDNDYYDPETYFFGPDQDSLYSFENCCDTLGINPTFVREVIRDPKWRLPKSYQSFLRLNRYAGVHPRMTIGICYDGRAEGSGGRSKEGVSQFRRNG